MIKLKPSLSKRWNVYAKVMVKIDRSTLLRAIFFRHDEFVESVSCLVQPMLVGWDAYYVPQWAWGMLDYFLFVSHDGFLDIETRTTEMYEKSLEILKFHEWPKVRVRSNA